MVIFFSESDTEWLTDITGPLIINSTSAITSAINMYNDGLMKEESHAITISIMAEKIRHTVED